MATDYLNALGVGSGLDTKQLVTALVDAEVAPKQSSIEKRLADAELQISGLAKLKSSMQTLQTAFATLNDAREFSFTSLSNSNTSALTATLNGGATVNGSQSITVDQLAKPSIMTSSSVADKTANLSAADEVFAFTVNGTQTSITLADGDSLEDLATKINDADNGATARVVEVASGSFKLFLQADEPGSDNAVTIDDDFLGIGDGVNEVQTAQNALVTYNGVSISRSSNVITDLVPGVTLNLQNVSLDSANIEVTRDDSAAADAIKNLVTSFNDFSAVMDELTAVGSEGGEGGAFASDPTIRNILTQAKELFFAEGSSAGANIKRMSDLGVSIDRNGTYQVDETKLASALTNHFDEIKTYFTADTDDQSMYGAANRGFAGDLLKQMEDYLGFNGLIQTRETSNQGKVADLTEDQKALEAKRAASEERYTRQFTTMNKIISEMNSLKDYLDNQLNNMPFTAKND